MTSHLLLGAGLAFAAVVQPGPLQAFLLARAAAHGWRRTLLEAATVNLLNPNPWIAWALVLGPAVVPAWRQAPAFAAAFVAAFYGVMVTGLAAFVLLASGARLLPERARAALVAASALVLAALGLWQLAAGARALLGA